jgi:hypothetical protein
VPFSRRAMPLKCSNPCRNRVRRGRNDPCFAKLPAIQFRLGTRPPLPPAPQLWRSKRRRMRSGPRRALRRPGPVQAKAAGGPWEVTMPQTQTSRPFGRLVAKTTSVERRLRSGRGRSGSRIGRSAAGQPEQQPDQPGFSRSFSRSSFFNSSRFFRRRRRLAAGRDAEGENSSGSSRHAQFELRHRLLPLVSAPGSEPPTQGGDSMPRINRDWQASRARTGSCISA